MQAEAALIISVNNNTAKLRDEKGDISTCYFPSHFPLRKNDVIYFTAQDGKIIHIHRFFLPNTIKEYSPHVRRLLRISMKELMDNFQKKWQFYSEERFLNFLDKAAAQWRFPNKCHIHELSTVFSLLGRDWTVENFLNFIYQERVERSLLLIGLEKEDIEQCPLDPHNLRSVISDDIWKGYFLHPDRCLAIARTRCQPCKAEKALAHSLVYKIFTASVQMGWSAFPRNELLHIQTPFGQGNEHILKMTEEIYQTHDIGQDVQLDSIYVAEKRVGEYLARLLLRNRNPIEEKLPEIVSTNLISDEQRQAIYGVCRNHLSVITGAAGTGKTFVISQIYRILCLLKKKVLISSFTGKAVARLNEVLPKSCAITLDMAISSTRLHKKIKQIDVLVIDEFSMVSTELLFRFISTFNKQFFRIILVGDINQLDAISWGNFAQTVLQFAPVFTLSYNYRSVLPEGQTNYIVKNSQSILQGQKQLVSSGNFLMPPLPPNENSLRRLIGELHQQKISPKRFIIITPYRDPLPSINQFCQELFILQENTRVTDVQGNIWSIGDKVRSLRNDYERNIMNGQEGYIKFIDPNEIIHVIFGEKEVTYRKTQIRYYLSLGYAITVHLSQGSEWEIVLFYLPTYSRVDNKFLNRTLLYTALTRGRRWIICLAEKEKIAKIIETTSQAKISHLADHIHRVLQENK